MKNNHRATPVKQVAPVTWPAQQKLIVVVAFLYIAQSLPLYFFNVAVPAILRHQGVDLRWIGLLSLLYLPWAFKFLWAPVVDNHYSLRIGKRKTWILAMQLLIILGFVALAQVTWVTIVLFLVLSFIISFAAATQDIAIDGYTLEQFDKKQYGMVSAMQSLGVACGSLCGGAGVLWLYHNYSWQVGLTTLAAVIAAISFLIGLLPDKQAKATVVNSTTVANNTSVVDNARVVDNTTAVNHAMVANNTNAVNDPTLVNNSITVEQDSTTINKISNANQTLSNHSSHAPQTLSSNDNCTTPQTFSDREALALGRSKTTPNIASLKSFFTRPEVKWLIILIIVFRFVETPAMAMLKPMLVDFGWSLPEIGVLFSVVGAIVGIGAALTAGWLIKKQGALTWLYRAGCLRSVSYVIVILVLCFREDLSHQLGWFGYDLFATSLGGAILLMLAIRYLSMTALYTIFMNYSSKKQAGTDFTMFASVELLVFFVGGASSGFLGHYLGYYYLYLLLVVVSVVSMLLLPSIVAKISQYPTPEE